MVVYTATSFRSATAWRVYREARFVELSEANGYKVGFVINNSNPMTTWGRPIGVTVQRQEVGVRNVGKSMRSR